MSNSETKTRGSLKDSKLGVFFKGVKTEFKKIIWPDRDTLLKQLLVVVVVTVILGGVIALLDFGYQNLLDLLMGITIG